MFTEQQTPTISVVIPAYNEKRGLGDSVRRIREALDASPQTNGAYEIIVCDNNSSDTTAAVAGGLGCTVVFESVNQISRARNKGAEVAVGEWLLFIDADSWPSPQLIGDMVPLLFDPGCIGCGATIHVVDGPRWFKFALESKNWSMRTFKWCWGGFILCRRDAFIELGGFPGDYFFFEELEFIKKLKRLARKRGQKFVILHKHPFNTSGRKAMKYGFWTWMKFAVSVVFSPRKAVRDKAAADLWYDVDR